MKNIIADLLNADNYPKQPQDFPTTGEFSVGGLGTAEAEAYAVAIIQRLQKDNCWREFTRAELDKDPRLVAFGSHPEDIGNDTGYSIGGHDGWWGLIRNGSIVPSGVDDKFMVTTHLIETCYSTCHRRPVSNRMTSRPGLKRKR